MKKPGSILTVFLLVLGTTLSGQQVPGSGENLLQLFQSGNTTGLLKIFKEDPQQMKADLGNGMTPLHYAAYFGDVSVFDYLMQNGGNLNTLDQRGLTPVWFTVSGQRPVMLRKLIAMGADLSIKNAEGDNLLFRAITARNPELVQILLDNGFDALQPNGYNMTPIEYAANANSAEIMGLLVSKGATLQVPSNRLSLLHRAAVSGGAEALHYLLDRGFEIDQKDANRGTPLMMALDFGNVEAARALIMRGANINLANSEGMVPMQIAVSKGAAELIDLFISKKADLTVLDGRTGKSLLHEAALRGNSSMVSKLLATGIPKNSKDKQGYTALSYALKYGNKTCADLLSKAGVGFAVEVDGLTIYHAGDHSNNSLEMKDNPFFPEIDFLAEKGIHPDISFFLNMYGCGSSNPEAFQKGIFYAVDKLKIKSVLPMHGADREWVYRNLADGVSKNNIKVDVGAAANQGDRFFFSKGSLVNQ